MQTVHSGLRPIYRGMPRFARQDLPAELSQSAGGMKGLNPRRRDIMPQGKGVAGLVWGRPATLLPLNSLSKIKRIRARSTVALWLLIGLWLFICLFVLLAMGLHWKL